MRNSGGAWLQNIAVSDALPECQLAGPTGDDGDGQLAVGETWTYTCQIAFCTDPHFALPGATPQTTSSDLVRLSLEGLPSARPRVDGVQRMRSANGHIEVRAVGSAVEVVYSMHTELGGGIPLWLANQNVHELPLQTLTQLKRRLEHRGK